MFFSCYIKCKLLLFSLHVNVSIVIRSVVTFHLTFLCFHHKNCAKLYKQSHYTSKFIPTSIRNTDFQTIKSVRITPYFELRHLHYTNWIVIFRVTVGCTTCQLMVIDLIGQLNGDVIDLSVKL